MSVKFERDTVRQGPGGFPLPSVPGVASAASAVGGMAGAAGLVAGMSGARDGHIPGTTGRHPLAEAVGTALTGGRADAGTKGYLAVRTDPIPAPSTSRR